MIALVAGCTNADEVSVGERLTSPIDASAADGARTPALADAQPALGPPSRAAAALDQLVADARHNTSPERRLAGARLPLTFDEIEAATGQPAALPSVSWSPRGFVTALAAPALRIPVADATATTPENRAMAFLRERAPIFGIVNVDTDLGSPQSFAGTGRTVLQFGQHHGGLPVFDSTAIVHVDDAGDVTWVLARLVPDMAFPPNTPLLSDVDAIAAFTLHDGSTSGRSPGQAQATLGYLDPIVLGQSMGDVALVWRVVSTNERAYVDARTGELTLREGTSQHDEFHGEHREVYHCSGTCSFNDVPGTMSYDDICHTTPIACQPLTSDSPICDFPNGRTCILNPVPCDAGNWCEPIAGLDAPSANARDYMGSLYNYWSARLGRNGWDNSPLSLTHRMRITLDAGAWQGPDSGHPMGSLGDCNGEWFSDPLFTTGMDANQVMLGSQRLCRDVVAHEFTHGVDTAGGGTITSATSCTNSRAIAEGISDVVGEFFEHYAGGAPDWVHGTGCPSCATARNSSLISPGSVSAPCLSTSTASGGCGFEISSPILPQPDTWSNHRPECGSYWNLTIASRAGYLMGRESSAGAVVAHGVPVTGIGEADATAVWHRALTNDLGGSVAFTDFTNAIVMECTYSTSFGNCVNAVLATGLWTGDSTAGLTVTGSAPGSMSGMVDTAAWPLPGPTRRFITYQTAAGIMMQERTCQIGATTCAWGSAYAIEGGTFPAQRPAMTTVPGRAIYVCMVRSDGGVWCDNYNGISWMGGPDPDSATAGVIGSLSLAHFQGSLVLAYHTATGLYSRRLADGTSTWEAPLTIYTGQTMPDGPALASGAEDFWLGAPGELWAVWGAAASGGTLHEIWYARFNPSGPSWGSPSAISRIINPGSPFPTMSYYLTQAPIYAAFFRGRLHVAATGVGYGVTAPSDHTMWYGSCAPPCAPPTLSTPGDWTAFAPQEGAFDDGPYMDSYGPYDGYLHVLHQAFGGGDTIYNRVKRSD